MNEKYNIPDYVLQKIKSVNNHNLLKNNASNPNEINSVKVNNSDDFDFKELQNKSLNFKNNSSQNIEN